MSQQQSAIVHAVPGLPGTLADLIDRYVTYPLKPVWRVEVEFVEDIQEDWWQAEVVCMVWLVQELRSSDHNHPLVGWRATCTWVWRRSDEYVHTIDTYCINFFTHGDMLTFFCLNDYPTRKRHLP